MATVEHEQELWKRVRRGDAEAFGGFYRQHATRLQAFLRHYLGDAKAAEDVAQEAFLELWRHPNGFNPAGATLRAYLFGIATKRAANWWRHRAREKRAAASWQAGFRTEAATLMEDALARLEPEPRSLLWLREVEGYSCAELAAMLDIPLGFDVSNPETSAKVGGLIQVDDPGQSGFFSAGPNTRIAIRVKALDVRNDVVRLMVRARVFEPVPGSQEEKVANHESAQGFEEVMDRFFANTTPREFDYVPGRTLEIPAERGGKIMLKGEVFKLRPSFSAEWFPVTPKPDEIVLSKAALVRGREFLGEIHGLGSARATNSAIGVCVPPLGAFVFALKPFEGAVQGVAEFREARFKMDGYEYILFSATPITGGQQPREI